MCLGQACDHNSHGDLVSAGPGRGPCCRERLCDQLHFTRETDDGQAHLGFLLLYVSPEIEISEAVE